MTDEEIRNTRDLIKHYESEIGRLKGEMRRALEEKSMYKAAGAIVSRRTKRSALDKDIELAYKILKENDNYMFTADLAEAINTNLERTTAREYTSTDFGIGKYLLEDDRFTFQLEDNPKTGRPSKQYGLSEW